MKIIRLDDHWGRFDAKTWQEAMTPPSHGLEHPVLRGVLHDLKAHFPRPGHETHQEIPVILQPGKSIGPHAHPEWTLIYFIDAEHTPIVVRDIGIYVANNTALLLQPGTKHYVPRNQSDRPRLSLALRWAEDWDESA